MDQIKMNLAHQPTLPLMRIALADRNRRGMGIAGERTAQAMLERAGYLVSRAPIHHGDLKAIDPDTGQVWFIEVKTARRSKDKKWRFPLKPGGNARTAPWFADVVCLLAVMPSCRVIPFIVPIGQLLYQCQAVITSHPETYAGKLAQYRQIGGLKL